MEQKIITVDSEYQNLSQYFQEKGLQKIFLVAGNSLHLLKIGSYFDHIQDTDGITVVRFSDFQPNPLYESIVEGVHLFQKEKCDTIVAIGGGSAIDVAKCIKLFSNMDNQKSYLQQTIIPNDIPLLVMPTTAGAGSEATRYAVIYAQGEKQSISSLSCIPSAVFMDPSALETLPAYQKKSTMPDALCHAIESFWSLNSTEESRRCSKDAIREIMNNMDGYLENKKEQNAAMLRAANLAGRAINITQTTAGHAMAYKLTSLYGTAHGHAVALCVRRLWPYMLGHMDDCIDPRGTDYLHGIFRELAEVMGCDTLAKAAEKFQNLFDVLNLTVPEPKKDDYEILVASVNPIRLKNNPIGLTADDINLLYHQILGKDI